MNKAIRESLILKIAVCCFVFSTVSFAQFVEWECPEAIECFEGNTSIDIISSTIGEEPNPPVLICDALSPMSQNNLRFEAMSPEMLISVVNNNPASDINISISILDKCGPQAICIASEECSFTPELYTGDLVVGHEYILSVTGCGAVLEDVTVFFEPGAVEEMTPPRGLEFFGLPTCHIIGFCPGATLELDVYFEEGQTAYFYEKESATWQFSILELDREIETQSLWGFGFVVEEEGNYTLCLNSVQLACQDVYFDDLCLEFEIGEPQFDDYGVYEVCQHDLDSGSWVPDGKWEGGIIQEPGYYETDRSSECGCLFYQAIEVVVIEEELSEVIIELCPEDYPYVYFDEFEFDYSQFDIEEELYIYEGSLSQDYDEVSCDSLIYLILVNEDPQDRCSSCHLPVSLEKSKIVACIPFDNATIDVSGRRTIVRENGIGYDDNGSKTNDLWEAIFDGDEDYVEIPHIDDLNTSVFSFNLQFNKDERFENGDRETLISKGDIANDNLRYSVDLQKVDESKFDLLGTFYSETNLIEVNIPDLSNDRWYDIAYVVGTDSISVYLDGYIYSSIAINENLKGNTEDFYIGTLINDSERTQFYNGRLDNFKYWKQKLSGQDVLYLHFPEKEFEVDQSYFLSCCEEAVFGDVVINKENPLDSIIVPNASPTGYDSVYILNYIQNDRPPQINPLIEQEDIFIQYQQQCDEFCQATATWDIIASELFSDNCADLTIEQSHMSPLVLDENISFVDVVYSATDDCGQVTTFSFALELECLPSQVEEVPLENAFVTNVDGICIDDVTQTICKYSDILFVPGYLTETSSEIQMYNSSSDFNVTMSIDGISNTYSFDKVQSGIDFPQLKEEGTYTICLESVSSLCETVSVTYCETIHIGGSLEKDHGIIESCEDDVESMLPSDISEELKGLILTNLQTTSVSVSEEDDCGCEKIESIQLIIHEGAVESLDIEICEGDNYQGYDVEGTYIQSLLTTQGCDSIVSLNLQVIPTPVINLFAQICPDSTYMGYSESGQYEVWDTNVNGCDSLTNITIEVLEANDPLCMTSSLENNFKDEIVIFPNPVIDLLTITDRSENLKFYKVEILNVEGKILYRHHRKKQIDVTSWESGIYFLKVEDINGKTQISKFIKT